MAFVLEAPETISSRGALPLLHRRQFPPASSGKAQHHHLDERSGGQWPMQRVTECAVRPALKGQWRRGFQATSIALMLRGHADSTRVGAEGLRSA